MWLNAVASPSLFRWCAINRHGIGLSAVAPASTIVCVCARARAKYHWKRISIASDLLLSRRVWAVACACAHAHAQSTIHRAPHGNIMQYARTADLNTLHEPKWKADQEKKKLNTVHTHTQTHKHNKTHWNKEQKYWRRKKEISTDHRLS